MKMIDAEPVIKNIEDRIDKNYDSDRVYALGLESALSYVEIAPIIDAVSVTHCGAPCVYYDSSGSAPGYGRCKKLKCTMRREQFCCYGDDGR